MLECFLHFDVYVFVDAECRSSTRWRRWLEFSELHLSHVWVWSFHSSGLLVMSGRRFQVHFYALQVEVH